MCPCAGRHRLGQARIAVPTHLERSQHACSIADLPELDVLEELEGGAPPELDDRARPDCRRLRHDELTERLEHSVKETAIGVALKLELFRRQVVAQLLAVPDLRPDVLDRILRQRVVNALI